MAVNPLHRPGLRPGHDAELAKAVLSAIGKAKDQVVSVDKVHTALRRIKPKIRTTSTYAVLKRMTDCGWLERVDAGVCGPANP
jgi:Fe2+ or Zn2+ uptake regulation protein